MTIKQMHEISIVLDILGKKEHIFFMSKEEYEKEIDFVVSTYPPIKMSNEKSILDDISLATMVFDGIKFYIIDPRNLKSIVKLLPIAGAAIDIAPIGGLVV